MNELIVVRGGGDIATGTIHRLVRCGYKVIVTEVENPSAIRRKVAFCEAVFDKEVFVDGVGCKKISSLEQAEKVFSEKELRKKLSSKVNILLDDYEKGRTNYEDMIEEYLEFSLNPIFSENLKVEYYEKMRKASEEITSKIA